MTLRQYLPSPGSTAASEAVPSVDRPEPDTDRGLPTIVSVPVVVLVVTACGQLLVRSVSGDPIAWSHLPGVVTDGLTAAGVATTLQWLFGSG